MKVLVTGATGFVGSRIIERLFSSPIYKPKAVVRRDIAQHALNIESFVINDINSNIDWNHILDDTQVVIHTAARAHIMDDRVDDPLSEFRKINVAGTLNLARQAAEVGVKRFIYLSSIKVNGESTSANVPFTAKDKPNPIGAYAISKYEAEQGLLEIAKLTNMDVVIIRPPLVYGPGVKANFLSMMRWISKGIPLPLGSVNNKRSFVALDNLVDLILTCIEHPMAANEIFLVRDSQDLSTTELLRSMAMALNKQARLLPIPVWLLSAIAAVLGKRDIASRLLGSLQVDIKKTRNLLNWDPPVSVEVALKATADNYLSKY